jgi:hypothetical protein
MLAMEAVATAHGAADQEMLDGTASRSSTQPYFHDALLHLSLLECNGRWHWPKDWKAAAARPAFDL